MQNTIKVIGQMNLSSESEVDTFEDNDATRARTIERASGAREWYIHGKRYRDNGLPAVEHAIGVREWYFHGEQMVPT